MFCYFDFDSYLKANYPNSLPFVLKSTFTFEIHCKKHLKKPLKKSKGCKTLFGVCLKIQNAPWRTILYNTVQILLSTSHGGFPETNINSKGNKKKLLLKLLRNYLHINLWHQNLYVKSFLIVLVIVFFLITCTRWRQGGHHGDVYKYTAISRKVVG